jgi:CRP-like cAMP-binding protein
MLRAAKWSKGLTGDEFAHVCSETLDRVYAAGDVVCRKASMATHWIGVVDGMLTVDVESVDGRTTTLVGCTAGGWLGEGSVLKRELRPYEVVAMCDTRVALIPTQTFHRLFDSNLHFCHFMVDQLNARVAQFVALVQSYRMNDIPARVAYCVAELFNPQLSPGTTPKLRLSQEDVARLTGVSRQLAHKALHELQDAGLLSINYGSIGVLDLKGLHAYVKEHGGKS